MTHQPPTPDNELIDRFWDYLHGELDAEAARDLEKQLLADKHAAEACRELVEVMVMAQDAFKREGAALHELSQLTGPQLLAELARRESLAQATLADLSEPTVLHLNDRSAHEKISLAQLKAAGSYLFMHGIKSKSAMIGGIAAAILLAALLAVNFIGQPVQEIAEQAAQQNPTQRQGQIVATLASQQDARWAEPNITDGQPLRAGQRLTLIRGRAEIRTTAGAIALLESPVTVELIDHDNALRLSAGKLVGICETESSKGFLVRTPHMDITDLGTRFGVDVVPYRSTEVHVHQGEVRVEVPKSEGGALQSRQTVTSKQAVRVDGLSKAVSPIKPVFEKFNRKLATYRLPGTGVGLAEGTIVPNWQIIGDANGPLDEPLHVIVQHSRSEKYPHFDVHGNDPDIAQWLFIGVGGKSAYYPYETPGHVEPTRLLYEGRVDLPQDIDLHGKTLYLRYGCSQGLNALSINGKAIEPMPKNGYGDGKSLFREIELPIDQTALRPGENIIHVDLINHITPHMASFYLAWELRPQADPNTSKGETRP